MNLSMCCRRLLSVAAVVFLGLSRGMAQDSGGQTPPPTLPYIKLPPDHATWTMTVCGPDGSPLPPPSNPSTGKSEAPASTLSLELRQQQVAQTGKIRQEIDTWSNGTKTEDWIVGGVRLHEHPISHSIFVLDSAHMGALTSAYYALDDFISVTWPALSNYIGAEDYQKHLCYHYEKKSPPLPVGTGNSQDYVTRQIALANQPRMSGQAWIDVATRQMIAYNDGKELFIYVYGPPPDADLVLPPDYEKALTQYRDMMNPLKLHLPPTK